MNGLLGLFMLDLIGWDDDLLAFFVHQRGFLVGDDFYLVGFRMAEGDFIAHDAVFHGILQGSVQQNLNFLALDESHLDDALAETSVA